MNTPSCDLDLCESEAFRYYHHQWLCSLHFYDQVKASKALNHLVEKRLKRIGVKP